MSFTYVCCCLKDSSTDEHLVTMEVSFEMFGPVQGKHTLIFDTKLVNSKSFAC